VECAFARVFLVQSAFPFRPFSKQACQSQVTNYLQNGGGGGVSKDKKKMFQFSCDIKDIDPMET
jgi:hypothetical protein